LRFPEKFIRDGLLGDPGLPQLRVVKRAVSQANGGGG